MKTYGQYCGLAKALDHVGDRWTLLIVRELLVGSRKYSQIRAALPGIATNLLADRLRDLQSDGIVERDEADGTYELTEFGRGLEKAVHELVSWGGRWMGPRPPEEAFRPEWLVVALAAMLPRRRSGKVEIHTDGVVIGIDRSRVRMGPVSDAQAVVEAPADMLLGVVSGQLPFSMLTVTGDRALAERSLVPA